MILLCFNVDLYFQILEEHKQQGAEDQALEKRVEGKKAAAKKRATRRSEQPNPSPSLVTPQRLFLQLLERNRRRQ
jgi:condensin complex subunit 1